MLFHLVQQNRYNTATQLESIARSVREPLSSAILKGDIPEAEAILASIKPAGVVSRADVVLPNQFRALRKSFIPERPVPVMVTPCLSYRFKSRWRRLLARGSPAEARSQIAYLALRADSFKMLAMARVSMMSTCPLSGRDHLLAVAYPDRRPSAGALTAWFLHPLRNVVV